MELDDDEEGRFQWPLLPFSSQSRWERGGAGGRSSSTAPSTHSSPLRSVWGMRPWHRPRFSSALTGLLLLAVVAVIAVVTVSQTSLPSSLPSSWPVWFSSSKAVASEGLNVSSGLPPLLPRSRWWPPPGSGGSAGDEDEVRESLQLYDTNAEAIAFRRLRHCIQHPIAGGQVAVIVSALGKNAPAAISLSSASSSSTEPFCVLVVSPSSPRPSEEMKEEMEVTATSEPHLISVLYREEWSLLPFRSAKRHPMVDAGGAGDSPQRNVGYLLAVYAGARVIFDAVADEEYPPLPVQSLADTFPAPSPSALTSSSALLQEEAAVQLGQDTSVTHVVRTIQFSVWNEGGPAEGTVPHYVSPSHQEVTCMPIIQQLRRPSSAGAMTAVSGGVFASYDSTHSLHLRSAFFGLFLPSSTHLPYEDTMRSHLMETMMTFLRVDGCTSFTSPEEGTCEEAASAKDIPQGTHPAPRQVSEPCVLFRGASLSSSASSSSPLVPPPLLAFLSSRQRGSSQDLQLRLRDLGRPESDLLWLLYVDLYEAAIIPAAVVQQVEDWTADLRGLTANMERRKEASSASWSPLPQVAFRQQRFAVCLAFNNRAHYHSLTQLLHYHTLLHRHLLFINAVDFSQLTLPEQRLFLLQYPNVHYHGQDTQQGFYQQFTLQYCMEFWKHRLEPVTLPSPVNGSAGGHRRLVPVLDRLEGVLFTGDDLWINWDHIFDPAAFVTSSPPPPANETEVDVASSHWWLRREVDGPWGLPQLAYSLDEVWFPWSHEAVVNVSRNSTYLSPTFGWLREPVLWHGQVELYWQWPQLYRDVLDRLVGREKVRTGAISDLLYLPTAHRQFEVMSSILRITTAILQQQRLHVFVEALLPILVELLLDLAGRNGPTNPGEVTAGEALSRLPAHLHLTTAGREEMRAPIRPRPIPYWVLDGFVWGDDGRDLTDPQRLAGARQRMLADHLLVFHPLKTSNRTAPGSILHTQMMERQMGRLRRVNHLAVAPAAG